MDGTPRPPGGPAPLAAMCRDRCWKTSARLTNCKPAGFDPAQFSVVARWCSYSATYSVLFGCPAGVDLVAKDGQRWQPSYSYGPPFPRIRCNRQPTSPILSFVRCSSAIVRYVSTAFRSRLDAALRNLRGRHDQDRKAAPDRITPARLRLQVPRLQPDNVGRAGAAGRSDPSPGRVNAAGRGASQDRSHLKTPIPHDGPGFFLAMLHVKLRPNFR